MFNIGSLKKDIGRCRWIQDRSLSSPDAFRNRIFFCDGLSKRNLLEICKSAAISSGVQLQRNFACPWCIVRVRQLTFCRTSVS